MASTLFAAGDHLRSSEVTGTAGNWVMTSTAGKWIMTGMAGKEIDPQRARAARDVVRQHPAIALFAASPVLIAAGLVWWLASPGWAIVLLVAALVAGGFAVVRKR